MITVRSMLLFAALAVLESDLCVHGGVVKNLRNRRRRSNLRPDDAADREELARFRRQLNLPDDPSANTGDVDNLTILGPNDSTDRPGGSGGSHPSFGGGVPPSTGGSPPPLGGVPDLVPQLQPPAQIFRTFFPTDPSFGPTTEVINLPRVPNSIPSRINTVTHTRLIHEVSISTVTFFSVQTNTVSSGLTVTVTQPPVTYVNECEEPATITHYLPSPPSTNTVTVYNSLSPQTVSPQVDHDSNVPPTFYLTTSNRGDVGYETTYEGRNVDTDDGGTVENVLVQPSGFTTPRTLPTTQPEQGSATTEYNYDPVSEPFTPGHSSGSDKLRLKRMARAFVDDYDRTILNY